MYICIGTHRINVDQIQTYKLNQEDGYLFIKFSTESHLMFIDTEYDLDILTLELDRVCNPKVLKGKLDEK